MGGDGPEERGQGLNGGHLHLLGYLKSNKRVAYVLAIMLMLHLSNQYDRYLFTSAKVPFLDYESYDFALIAGPCFTSVNSVAGVFLSFLGDVRPVRLLCTACVVWSASTGAVALSKRFWQVVLARIGQGIGDAACNPFAASILRDHFGPDYIGSAIGVYFAGLYAGFSLSLGIGTLSAVNLGWKWAYWLAALGGFLVAAVAYWTIPEPAPLVLSEAVEFTGCNVDGGGVASSATVEDNIEHAGSGALAERTPLRSLMASPPPRYQPLPSQDAAECAHLASGNSILIRSSSAPSSQLLDSLPRSRERQTRTPLGAEAGPNHHQRGSPSPSPLPPRLQRFLDPLRRFRAKLPDLAAAWLGSPSLLLVCLAGGVRDAGGFVFGYYLASFFSPLLNVNAHLTGRDPCSFSFNPDYEEEQICNEVFPWCVDGECNQLSGSPWHDAGMSASRLTMFVSWVPFVGGSLGAMIGGILSDRLAKRFGTAGRLWVVAVSNALASPFAAGVLLAPYPWCFACLFAVEVLGEMWIGVVLAVVMALVPRHVRVTSVALYNFIITNISGLSTTLVPVLRELYDSPQTFHFYAQPIAGAAAAASNVALGSTSVSSGSEPVSTSSSVVTNASDQGWRFTMAVRAEAEVEMSVSQAGSWGLQAALLWIYPGMYLVSSVFCLAAILALGRDRRGKTVCNRTAEVNARVTPPTVASTTVVPQNSEDAGAVRSCTEGEGEGSAGEEENGGKDGNSHVRMETAHAPLLRGEESPSDVRKVAMTI